MLITGASTINTKVDNAVRAYIVEILLKNCFSYETDVEQALAILYMQALAENSKNKRYMLYKKLGDTSLFAVGMFNDYVKSTINGEKYYIDIGITSYKTACEYSIVSAHTLATVATEFVNIVNVLKYVAANVQHVTKCNSIVY